MDSVYFVFLGANADMKAFRQTPLEVAKERLGERSDPGGKQRYEEVHEDTHTIKHFDIAMVAERKFVPF